MTIPQPPQPPNEPNGSQPSSSPYGQQPPVPPQQPPYAAGAQPTDPYGTPQPPADEQPTQAYDSQQYGAHAPYGAPPAYAQPTGPQKPRPGKTLALVALILAIAGTVAATLGFFAGISMIFAYVSFVAWPLLIAALIISIIALAKKAEGKGMSITALIVSIVGGIVAIASVITVVVVSIANAGAAIWDEYGDDFDDYGQFDEDGFGAPETSEPSDPGAASGDVQADCDRLMTYDTSDWSADAPVDDYLEEVAAEMQTADVRDPLLRMAESFDDAMDFDDPEGMEAALAELEQASTELASTCGVDLGF